MSSAAAHLNPADPAGQQAEDAQYYRRVLHELIDMGTDLARAVHNQATADDGAADPAAAVAFDCLARTVRRTVALARKVAEPLPVRADAGWQRAAARRRIIREVQDVIQREVGGAEAEALEAELSERLDGPELDDEIGNRPVAEVITDICRDLGLLTLLGNHPWKRRTPPDFAALCARAAQPPGAACADQPGAGTTQAPAPAPSVAYYTPAHAGPQPYSQKFAIELMHKLLDHGPPIRGP